MAALRVPVVQPGRWFPSMCLEHESVQREAARQFALRDFMSARSSVLGYGMQAALLVRCIESRLLFAWVLGMVFFETINGFLAWQLGRHVADRASRPWRLRQVSVALFGSGSCWGCVALLPGLPIEPQAYLFHLLFLVTVGIFSVQNLCLSWPSLIAFNLGLVWPMAYAAESETSPSLQGVQVIACGLLVMVQIYALTSRKVFLQGMRARRQTEALAEALHQKNEDLTDALKAIEKMAELDPLTQCLNRRALMQQLLGPNGQPGSGPSFGVILLDLDHFKQINDSFGHGVGDRVLVAAAERLRGQLRTQDSLARWGGEEFLCLMRDVDETGLEAMADRLRGALADVPVLPAPNEISVTASVGLALCGHGQGLDDVIEQADQAMYRAKQKGRNRVEGRAGASLAAPARSATT